MKRKHPADNPMLTDEDRAWLEMQARAGRAPELPMRPSRSWFGRLLDHLDGAASAARGNHWR